MNGFLNILKPPGMSSGAVVAIVKRMTGERTGHAGTLDPEAAGVLPVMVGRATRLLEYFTDKSKSYTAEIAFTGATDTQDAQGEITEKCDHVPSREAIEAILPAFRGTILQRPPAYSALKRDGVPLYALARKGQMVETEARETEIRELILGQATARGGYMLHIDCGGGTYIRTLCHDLGKALGAPAHMRFLLRTRAGAFSIENAVTLEELKQHGTESSLLPMDYPLMGLPELRLSESWWKLARNGGKLPANLMPELAENQRVRVYTNELNGVAHRAGSVIRFDVGVTGA